MSIISFKFQHFSGPALPWKPNFPISWTHKCSVPTTIGPCVCVQWVRMVQGNSPGLWHLAEVGLNPSSAISQLWPWASYSIIFLHCGVNNHKAWESCCKD
jgi:hypothetical protein